MSRSRIRARWWLAAAAGLVVAPGLRAQQLVDFAIEDQFGREVRRQDFADRVVVLMLADREGSEWSEPWAVALAEALADDPVRERVALVPAAHVKGVPFFIKGTVRRSFSREPAQWVLLDWDGVFDRAYAMVPGRVNVLVFLPDGAQVGRVDATDVTPAQLDTVLALMRAAAEGAILSP